MFAARRDQRTLPATPFFGVSTYRQWTRSHGRAATAATRSESPWWPVFVNALTCFGCCFAKRVAWREKVALCALAAVAMALLVATALLLPRRLCTATAPLFALNQTDHASPAFHNLVKVRGLWFPRPQLQEVLRANGVAVNITSDWLSQDITPLFAPAVDACSPFFPVRNQPSCSVPNRFPRSPPLQPEPNQPCPNLDWLGFIKPMRPAVFSWKDLSENSQQHVSTPHQLFVWNGAVVNITALTPFFDANLASLIESVLGTDGTLAFSSKQSLKDLVACLTQTSTVGF
ncbi:hypothetical protein BC830DRAFT_1176076, partial [Chytriomyces sp. MP71]